MVYGSSVINLRITINKMMMSVYFADEYYMYGLIVVYGVV